MLCHVAETASSCCSRKLRVIVALQLATERAGQQTGCAAAVTAPVDPRALPYRNCWQGCGRHRNVHQPKYYVYTM